MDKKIMYVIVAVAVLAVAAAAVFMLANNSSENHESVSFDDTRLRIYGNANGDDQIDKTDLNIVKWIIDSNNDADVTKYTPFDSLSIRAGYTAFCYTIARSAKAELWRKGEKSNASKQFACCKAVVEGNVRNFHERRHLAEETHNAFTSLRVSFKAIRTASFEIRREVFFSFRLSSGGIQTLPLVKRRRK